MNKTKFNLSFAGCGFLGIYHVGVAACLKKYAPHLVVSRASGASAGAIAAACLLCDAPLGQITKDVLRIATLARSKTLGPFSPSFNIQKILRDGLEKILPEDAHLKVNGKLNISLTRAHDRQNVIASEFNSRNELIQALLCSAFIPLFSGFIPPVFRNHRYLDGGFTDNVPVPEYDLNENIVTISPFAGETDICPPRDNGYSICALLCSSFVPIFSGWMPPKFQNIRYMDGCYSDNLPIIDNNTITVSPFCGELSDICPRDDNHSLLQINLANTSIELSRENLYRFSRTLFPPKPEILSKMCQQGFDDTLRFLARNDLIGCTDCTLDLMDLKSNPSNDSENLGEELNEIASKNYDKIMSEESCHQCKVQRESAMLDTLPETVVSILQDAIDSGNRGLFNWLFSHQSVRIISLMSLPCLLPADLAYATALKLYEKAPKFTYNIRVLSEAVIQLVANTLAKMSMNRSMYTAQLSCQLAITEYDEDLEPQSKVQKYIPSRISAVIRNKMNFGFTLNIDKRESQSQQLDHYTTIRTPERRRSLLELEVELEGDEVLKMTEKQEALMACYYLHNYSGTIEAYNCEGNHLCQQNSVLCEVN